MRDYAAFLREDAFVIYLFHGVIPKERAGIRNYTSKHISLARFETILRTILRKGTPVSMDDVAASLSGGPPLPPRAFAVTFDDGFKNNATTAAPLLEDLGIPATFYLTTGFLDGEGPSWIDRIERSFDAVPCVRLDDFPPLPPRTAKTEEEKKSLLDEIRFLVKKDRRTDPVEFAEAVCSALGRGTFDPDLDAFLSWDDVRLLAGNIFTFGGHGRSHRILSYLRNDDLREEIHGSIDRIEKELGGRVLHFSYPEGLFDSIDERVVEMLRSRNVICACLAEEGVNGPLSDPFRLRRVLVV